MIGCPPKEAVVGSPVTFPKFCGLRKSTVVSGLLKLNVLNAFCISHRSCALYFSLIVKFFCAENVVQRSGVPVTILRPALPTRKSHCVRSKPAGMTAGQLPGSAKCDRPL